MRKILIYFGIILLIIFLFIYPFGNLIINNINLLNLLKKGISRGVLDRVHAPIGLDIHSETPEEIAVSIAAQLIKERRRGLA